MMFHMHIASVLDKSKGLFAAWELNEVSILNQSGALLEWLRSSWNKWI